MLRKLFGAAVVCTIVLGAGLASSGTKECEDAKQEVEKAQAALSAAERECTNKSNGYAKCIRDNPNNQGNCNGEKEAMRAAKKKVKEAREALQFARSKQKQACG